MSLCQQKKNNKKLKRSSLTLENLTKLKLGLNIKPGLVFLISVQ